MFFRNPFVDLALSACFGLKRVLVIFLALLQFVAPLVHAHAGGKSQLLANTSSAQVHIPGLESYGIEFDGSMLESVSSHYNADGIIISVDVGITQKQAKLIVDSDNNYFIPQQSVVIEHSVSPFDNNFSPPVPVYLCWHLITSHSPRAPPAQ